ncbi:MAG: hypothetical protein AB8F74_13835, partial [Saprospiraceae bacterium]
MQQQVKVRFLNSFNAKYQRNNKNTGHKNLRCFPTCCLDVGHESRKFCGTKVMIEIHVPSHWLTSNFIEIHAFA